MMIDFCKEYEFPTVPIETDNIIFSDDINIEKLLEMAKGKYSLSHKHREGIVVRPLINCYSPTLCGPLSFKVINNDFLEKEGE